MNTLPRFLSIPLSLSLSPPLCLLPFLFLSLQYPHSLLAPPHPHPRSFDTFRAASNSACVVAPPHCFLLFWHALHALCNHTGPARDVSRQQGGDAHKLSTHGSREIQRPRALCLCPVSRGVPHLQECVTFPIILPRQVTQVAPVR
jgi:hypothetical protein